MAPREQIREELRRKIIAAARHLLSETESVEFSMRALAAKADVAHMTPYNVFGSRQAVLLAVLDADIAEFIRAVESRRTSDPLADIFKVASLSIEFWFSDPIFYKTLYREVLTPKEALTSTTASPLREEFWRQLVRSLIQHGHLRDFVAEKPFAINLRRIVLQTISVWIARDLPKRKVEAELGYSIALALLGVTVAKSSARVRERLIAYQETLLDR